jgi:hypothetical protein
MNAEEWVSRFAKEIFRLGSDAPPERIEELGRQLWPLLDAVEPEAAARGEFDLWPPHDG